MIQSLYSAITLLMATGIIFITGRGIVAAHQPALISPLPDSGTIEIQETIQPTRFPITFSSIIPTPSPTPSTSLASVIADSLTGTKGTYGIVVKHLSTGESYAYNADRAFPTASLYKLWVMATVFNKIEQGSIDKDEMLSSSIPSLNTFFNINPEYAELTDGNISLSVRDALTQMITISHNYAAMLLTKRVTLSAITDFLTTHGLTESVPGEPPVSTARDIALFYELLFKNKLANENSTDSMITLLKNQQLNEKLPKYLPDSVEVAHKTGELDYFSHDAGIVYTKHGPYIIVVMSETDNPPAANDRIASLSKAIYEYFE